MRFWQHRWKKFNNWLEIFSSKSKKVKRFWVFSKIFAFSNFLWTRRMQFWKTRRNRVGKKLKIVSSRAGCDKETIILSKKFFFFKLVLWTRRIQFRQNKRSFFGIRPLLFHSIFYNKKKLSSFFGKVFFLGMFAWKREMRLGKPRRNLVDKKAEKFLPELRMW